MERSRRSFSHPHGIPAHPMLDPKMFPHLISQSMSHREQVAKLKELEGQSWINDQQNQMQRYHQPHLVPYARAAFPVYGSHWQNPPGHIPFPPPQQPMPARPSTQILRCPPAGMMPPPAQHHWQRNNTLRNNNPSPRRSSSLPSVDSEFDQSQNSASSLESPPPPPQDQSGNIRHSSSPSRWDSKQPLSPPPPAPMNNQHPPGSQNGSSPSSVPTPPSKPSSSRKKKNLNSAKNNGTGKLTRVKTEPRSSPADRSTPTKPQSSQHPPSRTGTSQDDPKTNNDNHNRGQMKALSLVEEVELSESSDDGPLIPAALLMRNLQKFAAGHYPAAAASQTIVVCSQSDEEKNGANKNDDSPPNNELSLPHAPSRKSSRFDILLESTSSGTAMTHDQTNDLSLSNKEAELIDTSPLSDEGERKVDRISTDHQVEGKNTGKGREFHDEERDGSLSAKEQMGVNRRDDVISKESTTHPPTHADPDGEVDPSTLDSSVRGSSLPTSSIDPSTLKNPLLSSVDEHSLPKSKLTKKNTSILSKTLVHANDEFSILTESNNTEKVAIIGIVETEKQPEEVTDTIENPTTATDFVQRSLMDFSVHPSPTDEDPEKVAGKGDEPTTKEAISASNADLPTCDPANSDGFTRHVPLNVETSAFEAAFWSCEVSPASDGGWAKLDDYSPSALMELHRVDEEPYLPGVDLPDTLGALSTDDAYVNANTEGTLAKRDSGQVATPVEIDPNAVLSFDRNTNKGKRKADDRDRRKDQSDDSKGDDVVWHDAVESEMNSSMSGIVLLPSSDTSGAPTVPMESSKENLPDNSHAPKDDRKSKALDAEEELRRNLRIKDCERSQISLNRTPISPMRIQNPRRTVVERKKKLRAVSPSRTSSDTTDAVPVRDLDSRQDPQPRDTGTLRQSRSSSVSSVRSSQTLSKLRSRHSKDLSIRPALSASLLCLRRYRQSSELPLTPPDLMRLYEAFTRNYEPSSELLKARRDPSRFFTLACARYFGGLKTVIDSDAAETMNEMQQDIIDHFGLKPWSPTTELDFETMLESFVPLCSARGIKSSPSALWYGLMMIVENVPAEVVQFALAVDDAEQGIHAFAAYLWVTEDSANDFGTEIKNVVVTSSQSTKVRFSAITSRARTLVARHSRMALRRAAYCPSIQPGFLNPEFVCNVLAFLSVSAIGSRLKAWFNRPSTSAHQQSAISNNDKDVLMPAPGRHIDDVLQRLEDYCIDYKTSGGGLNNSTQGSSHLSVTSALKRSTSELNPRPKPRQDGVHPQSLGTAASKRPTMSPSEHPSAPMVPAQTLKIGLPAVASKQPRKRRKYNPSDVSATGASPKNTTRSVIEVSTRTTLRSNATENAPPAQSDPRQHFLDPSNASNTSTSKQTGSKGTGLTLYDSLPHGSTKATVIKAKAKAKLAFSKNKILSSKAFSAPSPTKGNNRKAEGNTSRRRVVISPQGNQRVPINPNLIQNVKNGHPAMLPQNLNVQVTNPQDDAAFRQRNDFPTFDLEHSPIYGLEGYDPPAYSVGLQMPHQHGMWLGSTYTSSGMDISSNMNHQGMQDRNDGTRRQTRFR